MARSVWFGSYGYCNECDKKWYARNAVGLAAQHHYKTGHHCIVEVTSGIFFGEPKEEDEGKKEEEDGSSA